MVLSSISCFNLGLVVTIPSIRLELSVLCILAISIRCLSSLGFCLVNNSCLPLYSCICETYDSIPLSSLSFVFCLFLSPNRFYLHPIIPRIWEKTNCFGRLFTRQTKKAHNHRRVPDSVNTQEILFTEISSHTPLRGKKKDPEPFLVRDLSKSIFSFLPTNWDFFILPSLHGIHLYLHHSRHVCLP